MDEQLYKALIIGAYGHTVDALAACRKDPRFGGVSGAVSLSKDEPLADYLSTMGVTPHYMWTSLTDALETESKGLAIVSSRPRHIAPAISMIVNAGWPIMTEKPMAVSMSELRALYHQWRQQPTPLAVILNMRSQPAFQLARRFICEGAIGKIRLLNVRKSYRWGERPVWFGDPQEDGGLFGWIGIHAFDIASYLTGKHFVEVSARAYNAHHPQHPRAWDTGCAHATLEDGTLVTVAVDLHRPWQAESHGDDWCRVVGDKGVIEADAQRGTIRILGQEGKAKTIHATETPHLYLGKWLEARLGNPSDWMPFVQDAFKLTAAALAAQESAEDNNTKKLDPKKWITSSPSP